MEENSSDAGAVWRKSASLIICVKSQHNTDGFDYEILMLKRSSRTAVDENQVVFPGGMFDRSDESVEWLQYFEEFGIKQQTLQELILDDSTIKRPNILAPQGNGCSDRFFKKSIIWAREISLRINAIRETFEEVGVLLCRNRKQLYKSTTEGFYMQNFDRNTWQQLVHDDPKNFLKMCKNLKVVPDLWSLHEWSCWASPAVFKKGYETVFFITFLNEKPLVTCEESEVSEHLWRSPATLLRMVQNMEIFFLPPQFYEISRFASHHFYNYIKTFAKNRCCKGVTMHMPIVYYCTDGSVLTLPGDEYYTGYPQLATEFRKMNCPVKDFRKRSKQLHRIENGSTPNSVLYLNFEPLDGHLIPLCCGGNKNNL